LASQQQLDFLELVDYRGAPYFLRRSGRQNSDIRRRQLLPPFLPTPWVPPLKLPASAGAFLKREELPDGATLGLFVVRTVRVGEQPLYVIGGERLDQKFLSTLDIPAGTRVMLYQNLDAKWNPKSLLDLNGSAAGVR
jgi:hypothetical protein